MKILMTADTIGGVWHYALELSRALGQSAIEVALATMGKPLSRDQRQAIRTLPNVEVFESQYRLCWMEDPWKDVEAAGPWLLEVAAQVRPSVVHLNDYVHGTLPWPAPVLMVGHSCVLSWWEAVRQEPLPRPWDRYRAEVARGLHAADLVIAPTKAMLTALNQFYGPLTSQRVIPNGRRPMDYPQTQKRPIVLAAGRLWDEAKNIAALAEIAPRLAWPVYLAGEERHPDGGMRSFPNVRYLGRLSSSALASWHGCAGIYALPARYEPFGLSALEAALAGCALVLGDISSLREVWQDAALFVSPDNSEVLHEVLQALIHNAGLRDHYARKAHARACTFTAERMAAAYRQAYQGLIDAGSPVTTAAGSVA